MDSPQPVLGWCSPVASGRWRAPHLWRCAQGPKRSRASRGPSSLAYFDYTLPWLLEVTVLSLGESASPFISSPLLLFQMVSFHRSSNLRSLCKSHTDRRNQRREVTANPTWEVASFHGNDLHCSSQVDGRARPPPPSTLKPALLGILSACL